MNAALRSSLLAIYYLLLYYERDFFFFALMCLIKQKENPGLSAKRCNVLNK